MPFKPSKELSELFANEVYECKCEECVKFSMDALLYAGELALNATFPLEPEIVDAVHNMSTAEFEIHLSTLQQNAIWYGLTNKPENKEIAGRRLEEATAALRTLFYARKK